MIVDCSVGVVVKTFVPHKVYYHVIGEYAAGMSRAKMSNSFTVSMISVSQIYTNRFSKQKYKSSAWTSVNQAAGVTGII